MLHPVLLMLLGRLSDVAWKATQELQDWLLCFFKIPTVYERFGDGSSRASIIHTIARQEQDANVEGVDGPASHGIRSRIVLVVVSPVGFDRIRIGGALRRRPCPS